MLNLLRRSASSSAEVYYESKGFSANYFTYLPNDNVNISLFEGSIWNRGDSLSSKFSHPLYYNPIPGISGLILDGKNEVSTVLGLNFGASITDKHRVYSQLAIHDLSIDLIGAQVGYRGYNYFGLNDFMLQVEWNHLPARFYNNTNPRLNYVNNNLPLAHTKGDGFDEIILRINYMYKRFYIDQSLILFFTKDFNESSLLPITQSLVITSNNIVNSRTELGYRFNKKMNLTLFSALGYRTEPLYSNNTLVYFGLRTAIINHYTDF
jgi:hypothetical protein